MILPEPVAGLGLAEAVRRLRALAHGDETPMYWLLLTAILIAAGPAEGKAKDEEAIQGIWTVVFREFVGKNTPDADLKALQVTIDENALTLDHGQKMEKHAYRLHPSQKPKAIGLTKDRDRGESADPGHLLAGRRQLDALLVRERPRPPGARARNVDASQGEYFPLPRRPVSHGTTLVAPRAQVTLLGYGNDLVSLSALRDPQAPRFRDRPLSQSQHARFGFEAR